MNDAPVKYMERELTEENIPFISRESGKSEIELQFMLLALKEQGREGKKVRWQVRDEA
jgi:hypothetical protein